MIYNNHVNKEKKEIELMSKIKKVISIVFICIMAFIGVLSTSCSPMNNKTGMNTSLTTNEMGGGGVLLQ